MIEHYYRKMNKQQKIEERTLAEAEWYLDRRTSIRDVADNFMVGKSTVYNDFRVRLKDFNYDVYKEVVHLLHYNKVHSVEKMNKANDFRRNRR